MATVISMNAPGACRESFSANIPSIIRETIGEKIRHEELGALRQALDDGLRAVPPGEEALLFIRYQLQSHKDNCDKLLRRMRLLLHEAIDDIVNELVQDVVQELEVFGPVQVLDTKMTPSMSTEFSPMIHPTDESEYLAFQPKVPLADMGIRSPIQSVGATEMFQAVPYQPSLTNDIPGGSERVSIKENYSTAATSPLTHGTKRPAADAAVPAPEEPKKKPKTMQRLIKKTINPSQIEKDENVFVVEGHEGSYVYRCNRTKCKNELGVKVVFFTSFAEAHTHFDRVGHSIRNKDEMFKKWAYQVEDDETRHAAGGSRGEKKTSPIMQTPLTPKSPMTAAITTETKGKKLADSIRSKFVASRTSQEESVCASAERDKAPCEVVSRDTDTDIYVASDDEIVPSEAAAIVKLNARKKPRKSYRDKPLDEYADEFES